MLLPLSRLKRSVRNAPPACAPIRTSGATISAASARRTAIRRLDRGLRGSRTTRRNWSPAAVTSTLRRRDRIANGSPVARGAPLVVAQRVGACQGGRCSCPNVASIGVRALLLRSAPSQLEKARERPQLDRAPCSSPPRTFQAAARPRESSSRSTRHSSARASAASIAPSQSLSARRICPLRECTTRQRRRPAPPIL